jgi:hypothetical protein
VSRGAGAGGKQRRRRGSLRLVSEEEIGTPYPKCSLFLRALARVIDVSIAAGVYTVTGAAGPVLALLTLLLADGMLAGQSAGKRIMGVKVVYLPTRVPARFRESVLRNAPFGLVVLFGMMPSPLGMVAFCAGALLIGGVEAYRAVRDVSGWRLGDIWAQTQVIDGKVLAGTELPEAPGGARAPGRVMLTGGQQAERWLAARRRKQCESR